MKKIIFVFLCVSFVLITTFSADAGLLGTYYNLDYYHPDMEVWNGGSGMVESTLTGAAPTETASSDYNQFD
jgi:hypothetical protein